MWKFCYLLNVSGLFYEPFFENLCLKQCFLKWGTTDYLHQIPGSTPDVQIHFGGITHEGAFNQLPRRIFQKVRRLWSTWKGLRVLCPASKKLSFMGVGLYLYMWTYPLSWEDSQRSNECLGWTHFCLDILSLAVWNIFALCPAESWGTAGIPGFFSTGIQQWPYSLVRS